MLLDARTGMQVQVLAHPLAVLAVAWSPNGRLIATGDPAGAIRVWAVSQTEPATCVQVLTEHTDCVYELAFAPDSTILASASWDRTVKLWDLASGALHTTMTEHTDEVSRVAWSHDGRLLAISSRDPTIWLWDSEQARYEQALRGHTAEITGLTFVPDSSSLFSGSEDGTLRLWDVVGGQCTRIIEGHVDSLTVVDWSPDGTQVVSSGADALITIYAASGEPPPKLLRGQGTVFGLGWSADGHHIASNGRTNRIRLWDAASGDSLGVLQDPDDTFSFYFDVCMESRRTAPGEWNVSARCACFRGGEAAPALDWSGDPGLDPLMCAGVRMAHN